VLSISEICAMDILVVAATEMEIAPFIKTAGGVETLTCGVGIPSTIYQLTKKLSDRKYDLVIQAGIAGAFTKEIKKGEVVCVEEDVFGDIGIQEKKKFKTLFQAGFGNANEFPFTNGWLVNSKMPETALRKVKAVTINKISGRKKQTKLLKEMFAADIESMEGAAFHFVCLQENVPFLQLRSISNKVGERDKTKWAMEIAIEQLNLELIKLADQFTTR
jgi:futalosine hydrolase